MTTVCPSANASTSTHLGEVVIGAWAYAPTSTHLNRDDVPTLRGVQPAFFKCVDVDAFGRLGEVA